MKRRFQKALKRTPLGLKESMPFPTPTSPEFQQDCKEGIDSVVERDEEGQKEEKLLESGSIACTIEGSLGDASPDVQSQSLQRSFPEPPENNQGPFNAEFFDDFFNLAETIIFKEDPEDDVLSDDHFEGTVNPDLSSDIEPPQAPEDYENEQILLLEALLESAQPLPQTQHHFEPVHPAWIDVLEWEALEMSIGFANHPDVFDLSDVETDSSLEIFLDEEAYNARMAEILSQSEQSDGNSSDIPRAIYLLQQFGKVLAFFDRILQSIVKLWVVKVLVFVFKKLRVLENLAWLGTKARSIFGILKGPVDVCVHALTLALPSVEAFIGSFHEKPFLGIKGLRPTHSKIRLKSPASALLGAVKRNTLKSMASRARMLRERAEVGERSQLNYEGIGIWGFTSR